MSASAEHIPTLRRLRDRLSDLSMRNRSIRLIQVPKKRAFDLAWLDVVHPGDSARVLERVLNGRMQAAGLLSVGTDDDGAQALHKGLAYLEREVRFVEEERGAYDLSVGVLFVCGAAAEGKYIQAPLFLVPRRLMLDRRSSGGTRWTLEPMDDPKEVNVNRTLLLALQKFTDLTLDPEALEETAGDLLGGSREPGWLATLAQRTAECLRRQGLQADPSLDIWGKAPKRPLGIEVVPPLPVYRVSEVPAPPARKFELRPHAVLSRFPLADTALLTDYDDLVRHLEGNPTKPLGYAGALLGDRDTVADVSRRGRDRLTAKPTRWHIESTDESQEAVLTHVLDGRSMAVYGPPGTGKSQLIANLVASALAERKRVLVVSQKRPALDVVSQRLGSDLGRFLALVHDPVRDRQALSDRIIATLAPELSYGGKADTNERDRLLGIILEQEQWFRVVHDSLISHSASGGPPFEGGTPFEAYVRKLRYPGSPGALKVRSLPPATPGTLQDAIPHLVQYVTDMAQARTPDTWKRDRPEYGTISRDQLERFTDEKLCNTCETVEHIVAWDRGRPVDLDHLETTAGRAAEYQEIASWCARAVAGPAAAWEWVPRLARMKNPGGSIQRDTGALIDLLRLREAAAGRTLDTHTDSEATEQLFDEFGRTERTWYKFLLPAWYRCRDGVASVLAAADITAASLNDGIAEWRGRGAYGELLGELPDQLKVLGHAGLDLTRFTDADLERVRETALAAAQLIKGWRRMSEESRKLAGALPSSLNAAQRLASLAGYALKAPELVERLQAAVKALQAWVGPFASSWLQDARRGGSDAVLATRFREEVIAQFDALGAADRRITATRQRFPTLAPLAEQAASVADLPTEFWTAYSERWVRDVEVSQAILRDLDQDEASRRRDRLAHAWAELPRANRAVLLSTLHDRVAAVRPSDRTELRKRAEQKRKRWSVRKLVENLWEKGLSDLLPVWLCSPETVAAVFPLTPGFFDYVIFDEASQCTLAQGVTAVYRGKTCVVAGDEQQLPPSNLFSATLEDEEELDEVIDEESLLSRAKAAGADMSLTWHYRARYPELIQFSNRAFYNNALRVSPLPVPAFKPPALEWVPVPGGWTKRENETEGRMAVDLVERFLRDHPDQSIGVIALNRQQSDHINDLLDQRLQASPTLEERYKAAMALDLDSRPFIRNLENVQGDERDIIILSIAYSPDASGRVPLRFGALSKSGGERRLNVAVSRARRKTIVLCSFDPETQLWVEQASKGAQVLKEYLCAARRGGLGVPDAGDAAAPPAHVEAVRFLANRLRERGWTADAFVGASAARVDLAVRSRGQSDRYVLALLLDGPGAAWASSPIGREVGRIEYLRRYSWPVHPVTVRGLVQNADSVVEAVVARLEKEEARIDAVPAPPSVAIPPVWQKGAGPSAVPERSLPQAAPPTPAAAAGSMPREDLLPITSPSVPEPGVVMAGSTVRYKKVNTDDERQVVLAGPTIPLGTKSIRLDAPVAEALMDARVGDIVPMELQNGTVELKVLEVKPPPPSPVGASGASGAQG